MTQGSWPCVTWANTQMWEGLTTSNWWLMGDELHSARVWRSIPLGQYSRFVYSKKGQKYDNLDKNSVSFLFFGFGQKGSNYSSLEVRLISKIHNVPHFLTWSAPVRWIKLSRTEALNLSITSIANSSSPWEREKQDNAMNMKSKRRRSSEVGEQQEVI